MPAARITTTTNGTRRQAATAPTSTPSGRAHPAKPPSWVKVLTATSASSSAVAPRSKYRSTCAGTLLGVVAGSAIPDPSVFGVDAAFPAALLALLLPALRQSDARRVGLASAVIAVASTPFLAPGLPVLAGLLGLGVAGRR